MAASHVKGPRPNKNSDGQDRKPAPQQLAPPRAPQPPPGHTNPMSHPNAPIVKQQAAAAQPPAPVDASSPNGQRLDPVPSQDQRQVRENIAFKDLPQAGQAQVEQQQGLDPYAPLHMVQGQLQSTMAQGPTAPGSPVPADFDGPMVPPGVQSFPDDMAHLHALMQQGLGPGASPQEHALGQNAHAIAKAHMAQAEQNAQNSGAYAANTQHLGATMHALGSQGSLPAPQDVAAHVAALQQQLPQPVAPGQLPGMPPTAVPPPGSGLTPPPQAPAGPPEAQGVPSQPPPQLGSDAVPPAGPPAGGPPTTPQGAIPPDLLAQLRKRAQQMAAKRG